MPLDTEFLRRHYAEMSDEELLSIDRNDLVEAARKILDAELATRDSVEPEAFDVEEGDAPVVHPGVEVEEDWLEDAAEAYATNPRPGSNDPSQGSVDARNALEAAGIPCHLELFDDPDQGDDLRFRWRVLVPSKLIHRAHGVLERDLFNIEFEIQLRSHLEMLSDEELRSMEPEYAFCGLYDRLRRITRVYSEELKQRKMDR
jgi:hypothetical protein